MSFQVKEVKRKGPGMYTAYVLLPNRDKWDTSRWTDAKVYVVDPTCDTDPKMEAIVLAFLKTCELFEIEKAVKTEQPIYFE